MRCAKPSFPSGCGDVYAQKLAIKVLAAIYLGICYVSVGCWAYAGTFLRGFLNNPVGMRLFNRVMAALLVVSAVYLVLP
ncbi:threonine/homoserine/homoserine lactone efflux protein [Pseudomonas laurylsulfatiphila]